MKLTHPLADRDGSTPGRITINPGQHFDVAEDGTIEVPDDLVGDLEAAWDARFDDLDESGEDDLPVDPSEHTVDDLVEALQAVDDVDALEAIHDTEKAAKDRDGALDAIDDRIADLQEA